MNSFSGAIIGLITLISLGKTQDSITVSSFNTQPTGNFLVVNSFLGLLLAQFGKKVTQQ